MNTKQLITSVTGLAILLSLILNSCGPKVNVVSSNGIQKRKYRKGYHTNFVKKAKSGTTAHKSTTEMYSGIPDKSIITQNQINQDDITTGLVASAENAIEINDINSEQEETSFGLNIKNEITTPTSGNPNVQLNVKPYRKNKKSCHTLTRSLQYPRPNGNAIAGFILSLVGVMFTPLGLILGIIGIIFSLKGMKEIEQDPENWKGAGLATAGLVLGILGIVLGIIIIGYWLLLISLLAW